MKEKVAGILLCFVLLCLSHDGMTTVFYVSNSGNDSNSGLSSDLPWQTLSKVNSTVLKPGDKILFKRGDVFYGSLIIKQSGTVDSPITFGAYGTGQNPVLTGFTTVANWTDLGNNVWESTTPVSTLNSVNMVAINGVNTAMGRYPNTDTANGGYLTYQSHSAKKSITSSSLTGSPDWTGAEVIMRVNFFSIGRSAIESQAGETLYLKTETACEPSNNFGFFIQNDPKTLDRQNEWYYDPTTKKIRVYSLGMPSDVKVASVENLIEFTGGWSPATGVNTAFGCYCAIEDLSFVGANGCGIYIWKHWWVKLHDVKIQNSSFRFSGIDAISMDADKITIEGNTISDSNAQAVDLDRSTNFTLKNNTITNSGVLVGMAPDNGTFSAVSISGGTNSNSSVVEYNVIKNTAHDPISFGNDFVTIRYNFIDTYCTVIDDGAGIYGGSNAIITNNIVINGIGSRNGVYGTFPTIAAGIYSDNKAVNNEIGYNSICNTAGYGIFNNDNIGNMNIHHNNVFNASLAQFRINVRTTNTNSNFKVYNNIFVSFKATQRIGHILSVANNIVTLGAFDYNIYARPIDDTKVFEISQPSEWGRESKTLSDWQKFIGQDLNSHKSPKAITNESDIEFLYNETKNDKTITLDHPMIDFKGIKYAGTITLKPFTSVILIKDYNSTSNIPFVNPDNHTMQVYPNPSKGKFTVRYAQLPVTGSCIDVFDFSGRKITSRNISTCSEEFDLHGQTKGLYIIKSISGAKEVIYKLSLIH